MAAEFLPIFLSNIPYNMTQLYAVYVDCYYVSVAILSLMVALVAASFLVRWTGLPADPLTLAGAMYYVVDSNMLEELAARGGGGGGDNEEGVRADETAGGETKARAPMVFRGGATVGFRPMAGVSGQTRTQFGITHLDA